MIVVAGSQCRSYGPRTMKNHGSLLLAALLSTSLFACAQEEAPEGDELAGESALDGELGKSDGVNDTFTYYRVRPDYRKCVFPLCGGYHLNRVNRFYTRCADGSWQQECYVAELDWQNSGLGDSQATVLMHDSAGVLLRGEMETTSIGSYDDIGKMRVSEAWLGGSDDEAFGLFTKVRDNGLRCITTPCPNTLIESKLNSFLSTNLSEVWLQDTSASQEDVDSARAEMYGDDGLIVAGYRYWFWEQIWNKGRYATQFYKRVMPIVQATSCIVGGCSGQYCTDESEGPVISTCEWRPEYACFRDALCEVQTTGECGWTDTEASIACVDSLGNP